MSRNNLGVLECFLIFCLDFGEGDELEGKKERDARTHSVTKKIDQLAEAVNQICNHSSSIDKWYLFPPDL